MRPIHQGDPGRVNYYTPYPVANGVRDYFLHAGVLEVIRSLCRPCVRGFYRTYGLAPCRSLSCLAHPDHRSSRLRLPTVLYPPPTGGSTGRDGSVCQNRVMFRRNVFNTTYSRLRLSFAPGESCRPTDEPPSDVAISPSARRASHGASHGASHADLAESIRSAGVGRRNRTAAGLRLGREPRRPLAEAAR